MLNTLQIIITTDILKYKKVSLIVCKCPTKMTPIKHSVLAYEVLNVDGSECFHHLAAFQDLYLYMSTEI